MASSITPRNLFVITPPSSPTSKCTPSTTSIMETPPRQGVPLQLQTPSPSSRSSTPINHSYVETPKQFQQTTSGDETRSVYLITYSQADPLKAGDRQQFAEKIVTEFNRKDDVCEKWVSAVEIHRTTGIHYHMAIKLSKCRRWKEVKKNISEKYNIELHFSQIHSSYYDAYTYATKEDTNFATSFGHVNLENPPRPPRTSNASRAIRNAAQRRRESRDLAAGPSNSAGGTSSKKKEYVAPKLTNQQVGDIIIKNELRTVKHVHSFSKQMSKEGKHDLKHFLQKHPNQKYIQDILTTNWSIETATSDLDREKKTRLELLHECLNLECNVEEESGKVCEGSWLVAALETLKNQNVQRKLFSELVIKSLQNGRGKGSNLMIVGPTNCAKSFMLMPLTLIYKTFMSPSEGTYNWVSAPEQEIVFLNDIRYEEDGDKKVMEWRIFLNLLEGAPVNISMPKNFFAEDFLWKKRQAIFATAEHPIMRIKNGKVDASESAQMAQRWTILRFTHQYLFEDVNHNLIPCQKCFAELILNLDEQ